MTFSHSLLECVTTASNLHKLYSAVVVANLWPTAAEIARRRTGPSTRKPVRNSQLLMARMSYILQVLGESI